jgi:hypothetical protein
MGIAMRTMGIDTATGITVAITAGTMEDPV